MVSSGTRIFLCIILSLALSMSISQEVAGSKLSFLRVNGEKVIDDSEKEIMLRGFNVSFKDFPGVLGERDIRNMALSGANSIRLVLNFRQFESAPLRYDEAAFALLASILDWCEKYRVYAILDMHLAPGIQNPHDFVVHREGSYEFWRGEEYKERFFALWKEIARRCAGREVVAGYDLLNEAVPPGVEEYHRVMEEATRAIRSVDSHHIIFVEEAVLPGGKKELVSIDDGNAVYSIHFFYPPEFTFYTTTPDRAIAEYPGALAISGEKIGEARTDPVQGTVEWKKLRITSSPPDSAEVLIVTLSSKDNSGTVWFDDVSLEREGQQIDLPAPLVPNGSFEIDYPGINWKTSGPGVAVTEKVARTGRRSLVFSGCRSTASAESSPIKAETGAYSLTAWVRTDHATGDNYLSLSWHTRRVMKQVDKRALIENLRYAALFRSRHHVPIHVGEFTAHANPSSSSVIRYLTDLIGVMRDLGFHWSYWTYYSEYPGIGLYTGDPSSLARPLELSLLGREMKK